MSEGSAAIGRTVRAGLSGWTPGVRTSWAALAAGAVLSLLTRALPPGLAPLAPLFMIAAIVLASGALYRASFAGPAGWRGLRWAREEWRLSVVILLSLVIVAVVAAVLLVLIGGVAVGVARSNAPGFDNGSLEEWRLALSGPAAIPASLVPLASMIIMIWLFLRLSLAPAATVDLGKVQVLSAFGRSRGAVLTLAAAGAVLAGPAVILLIAIDYVGAIAGVSEDALVPQLVSVALLFFYLIPVWTSALVEVYRRQPVPTPGTFRI